MDQLKQKQFAVLRILFGILWLVDAILKWNPHFLNNFFDHITESAVGQPGISQALRQGFYRGNDSPLPDGSHDGSNA